MAISDKAFKEVCERLLALERSGAETIAKLALDKATDALAEVKALQKSTHQVVAVPSGSMEELEKKFQALNGLGKEDFLSDLQAQGFPDDPEEQV